MRDSYTNSPESVEKISHDLGEVPFIEFDNNRYKTNDLECLYSNVNWDELYDN